ncbi:hypothetical protein ACFYZ8_33265 [Streptomyces sp. NPDC001668]|uniref:hypothetical protein n=1 Tax=Streptomyces sp. NPDC001668 TaxID=3364598 RepID=UPI00368F9B10
MNLGFTGLALYISMYDTGALVTPYEADQVRAEAIARYGFDGLRAEAFKRALFCSAVEPDNHCDRFRWAEAAASFVDAA